MMKIKKERLIIWGSIFIVAQYILTFFIFHLTNKILLQALGCIIWLLSLYFGFAPIFILKKWGKVKQGKSYVHTTQLVKTNLYSIVRHPQYLAGILFSLSLMLLSLHWIVFMIGIIASSLIFMDIQAADQQAIEKFGEPYQEFMKTVPQVNFIVGITRKFRR